MSDLLLLQRLGPAETRDLLATRAPALAVETELLDGKDRIFQRREGVLVWSAERREWWTAVSSRPSDLVSERGRRLTGERHRTLPQALARLGAALAEPDPEQAGVRHRIADADPTYPGLPAAPGQVFAAVFPSPAGAALAQALEEASLRPGVRMEGPSDLEIRAGSGHLKGRAVLAIEGWPGQAELRRSSLLEFWSPFGIFERRPTVEEAVGQIRLAAALAQDSSGQTSDPAIAGWSLWCMEGTPGREAAAQGPLIGGALRRLDDRLSDLPDADLALRAGVRAARMAMDRAPEDPRSLRAAGAVLQAQGGRVSPVDAAAWSALGRLAEDLAAVQEAARADRQEARGVR